MTSASAYLTLTAGLIYLALGAAHWRYTFFSSRFDPHDDALKEKMKQATIRITRETTLWKAWVGFNASHSTGAMFFGIVLLIAATVSWSGPSLPLVWVIAVIHSAYYTWLAKVYWFRIPLAGTALATLLLLVAGIVQQLSDSPL